jgi:hypothetical protein
MTKPKPTTPREQADLGGSVLPLPDQQHRDHRVVDAETELEQQMHDRERTNRGRGEGLRENPDGAQPVDRLPGGLRGIAKPDKDPEEGDGRECRGGP